MCARLCVCVCVCAPIAAAAVGWVLRRPVIVVVVVEEDGVFARDKHGGFPKRVNSAGDELSLSLSFSVCLRVCFCVCIPRHAFYILSTLLARPLARVKTRTRTW